MDTLTKEKELYNTFSKLFDSGHRFIKPEEEDNITSGVFRKCKGSIIGETIRSLKDNLHEHVVIDGEFVEKEEMEEVVNRMFNYIAFLRKLQNN